MTQSSKEKAVRLRTRTVLALLAAGFAVVFVATAPWQIVGRSIGRLPVAFLPALVLLSAVFLVPKWRRPALESSGARWRAPRRMKWILFAAAAAFFGRVELAAFQSLNVNAWDFSVFELPITRTLTRGFLYSPIDHRSFLGTHASYALAAFLPAYWLHQTPFWLLAAQAGALAAAAAAGYGVFRGILRDDLAALFLSIALVLNTYTAKTAQYVFHIESFYPLAVMILCLAVRRRRIGLSVAAVLFLCSIKEDSVLICLGFGAMLAVTHRRQLRTAALVAAIGLTLYLVSTRLVMPAAAGSRAGDPWYASFWSQYGMTPLAAAAGMASHPTRVIADLHRSAIKDLFETFLFLPLLGFEWLIAAIPALVVYGTAGGGMNAVARFSLYYSAPVLPLLAVAAAGGIRRAAGLLARSRGNASIPFQRRTRRALAAAVLLVSALDGASYVFRAPKPERADIGAMVRMSPPDMLLLVQGSLAPHAGYSLNVTPLEKLSVTGRESVLVDLQSNPYPFPEADLRSFVAKVASDSRYEIVRSSHALYLFRPRPTRSKTGSRTRPLAQAGS